MNKVPPLVMWLAQAPNPTVPTNGNPAKPPDINGPKNVFIDDGNCPILLTLVNTGPSTSSEHIPSA